VKHNAVECRVPRKRMCKHLLKRQENFIASVLWSIYLHRNTFVYDLGCE
jgi:hypothetical protein